MPGEGVPVAGVRGSRIEVPTGERRLGDADFVEPVGQHEFVPHPPQRGPLLLDESPLLGGVRAGQPSVGPFQRGGLRQAAPAALLRGLLQVGGDRPGPAAASVRPCSAARSSCC